MVVVVEPVLADVGDIQVRPSVVVVIAHRNTHAPAVIGDARFCCDVSKSAIVVVMKECRVRGGRLAAERVVGHTIDQINVEPPVVVVVKQADSTAEGFHDQGLGWSSPTVFPGSEAGLAGNVLEDHAALINGSAGCDGAVLRIVYGCVGSSGAGTPGRLLRVEERREEHQ